MQAHPALPTPSACFGVACPLHKTCERYHAIEADPSPDDRIDTCKSGGAWPLFVLQPSKRGAQ